MIALGLPFIIVIICTIVLICGGRTGRRIVGVFLALLIVGMFLLVGVRVRAIPTKSVVSINTPSPSRSPVGYSGEHRVVYESNDDRLPQPAEPPQPAIPSARVPDERFADRKQTDRLDPDAYATLNSAAVQCSRRALRGYLESLPASSPPPHVQLTMALDPTTRAAVTAMIAREFSSLSVSTESETSTQPTTSDPFVLRMTVEADPPSNMSQGNARTVEVRLAGPAGERADRAISVEKLWVEDLGRWQKQHREELLSRRSGSARAGRDQHHNADQFIVVDGNQLAASPEEARSRAISLAVRQIEPWVQNRVGMILPGQMLSRLTSDASARTSMTTFLEAELAKGGQIEDMFLQRFERPYGVVYRQALLLNVPGPEVERLAGQYTSMAIVQQRQVGHTAATAAGLILLIVVVYLFLNAATKGYYVWSLRIGSVVLVALGVMTVLKLG